MARTKFGECPLCGRETELTFHHLIPRTLRRKKWFRRNFSAEQFSEGIDICRPCHDAVHRFIDEKTLGREFNTLEELRAHPELRKFTRWLASQDPGARPRVR